jgi:hypothetical protein
LNWSTSDGQHETIEFFSGIEFDNSLEDDDINCTVHTMSAGVTSRLQLHLSAKNLKNLGGLMGRSDPFAVVTVRGDNADNKPVVVGQTDV